MMRTAGIVAVVALTVPVGCSGENGGGSDVSETALATPETAAPAPAPTSAPAEQPQEQAAATEPGATQTMGQPAPGQKVPGPPLSTLFVVVETSLGNMVWALDVDHAPVSVANFLSYVDEGYYNGTIFHRVIDGFMIQGGGLTTDMTRKETRSPITNEWENGLKNTRGTIAMARTDDPNSATSQFFINVANNANLDKPISGGAGYAVFGWVFVGMNVVDEIRAVDTGVRMGRRDVPTVPVRINKIARINRKLAMMRLREEDSIKKRFPDG